MNVLLKQQHTYIIDQSIKLLKLINFSFRGDSVKNISIVDGLELMGQDFNCFLGSDAAQERGNCVELGIFISCSKKIINISGNPVSLTILGRFVSFLLQQRLCLQSSFVRQSKFRLIFEHHHCC